MWWYTNKSGHPIAFDRVPRFFMSRVDIRGEQLPLRTVVALTATDEMRPANAQHRATSNLSEGHAVQAGEGEVGALLVLDGEGDGAVDD